MQLDPNRGYDIIGDVHGCANTLAELLALMGYQKQQGVWQHPSRMALFLGDIVDRGPRIREALHMVRDMVEAEQAVCIMGNHEYNSLAWFTPQLDNPNEFVRRHSAHHLRIINETLEQFAAYPNDWQDFYNWFYSLPLFIEAGRFRLVHACWDERLINKLQDTCPNGCITKDFLQQSANPNSFAYKVLMRLLTGLQMPLSKGRVLVSRDGYRRHVFRTKFWAEQPQTYSDVVFQPDALPLDMMAEPLTEQQKKSCSIYSQSDPLLFLGHYWCDGAPQPIQANLACVDYSAVKYGKLVAYRLDDETTLDANKFVWVEVKRPH